MAFDTDVNKMPIENILYSNFIRYERMKELTEYQYSSSNADALNVYIDMSSIIKPLYNRVITGDPSIYTVLVLNLCAHIRAYYSSRHSVSTNIFIVYSDNTMRMTKVNQELLPYPNRSRDEIINWNINMLRTIVPYFPNLYFITGGAEPAVLIKNYIDKKMNLYPNMVLTKDLFCWQIPALDPNTCIFRPSKSKAGDISFVINHRNCMSQWVSRINSSKTIVNPLLSSSLFSLYIAMTSFKEKTLNSYFSPRDALARIEGFVNSSQILNGYNSPDTIKNILYSISTKMDTEDLYYRYKVADLQDATNKYKSYPVSDDMSWFYSKIDIYGVREINDKYFVNNPIDIIKLFR